MITFRENQHKQKDLENSLNIVTSKLKNTINKYTIQRTKLQNAKGKYKQLIQTMNIAVNLASGENLLTRNIETTIGKIRQSVRELNVQLVRTKYYIFSMEYRIKCISICRKVFVFVLYNLLVPRYLLNKKSNDFSKEKTNWKTN